MDFLLNIDFWSSVLKILLGTLASGSVLVFILSLIEKRVRFRRTMLALYYFYLMHGSRMKYISDIGDNGVSYGSFDLSGLRKAINNYLEMPDKKTDRLKLVIQLYDTVYQTAFHINIRSEERHLEKDCIGSESYKRGVAFAIDKYPEYINKLNELLEILPGRKTKKEKLVKDLNDALVKYDILNNSTNS